MERTRALLQGFLFAFVGMCAGLTGTVISNALLVLRHKLDPKFESQNEAPNVPLNAATWAAHMGISSNVRYQILNGIDMVSHFCFIPKSCCKAVRGVVRQQITDCIAAAAHLQFGMPAGHSLFAHMMQWNHNDMPLMWFPRLLLSGAQSSISAAGW